MMKKVASAHEVICGQRVRPSQWKGCSGATAMAGIMCDVGSGVAWTAWEVGSGVGVIGGDTGVAVAGIASDV